MAVLHVEDARKRFGDVEALRGVSLELREGEMLALLGPMHGALRRRVDMK